MASTSNQDEARAITSALGGLPLALNQIGGFITQRKIPLKSFLVLYNRNSASVDAKPTMNMNYNRTLATVWDMALRKVSGSAKTLHMILSFLDPDYIHGELLSQGALQVGDTALEFLGNEIE